MSRGMGEVWIGTSGWHYKHWIGAFYPARTPPAKMLGYYIDRFNTVELNNSFYHLPKEPALHHWRESTPDIFCFAAKGSRFLTHMKKLSDPEQGLQKFMAAIEILGPKLGPILFQLPPNWELNLERFAHFLEVLPRYHRYAFEFRNPTWHVAPVYELMKRHNAAYCIFDLAGYQSPLEVIADFAYIRLHGPGGKYQGTYSEDALTLWAQRICNWRRTLRAVYCYFDNDDSGYAPRNALQLKELISTVP
ncbi:MAG: DUF72 domain-containing protein [Acidobacteriaceae bacterium]|nr:DUF72 domain-containing protein [Acidobacteriaceae bacterium]